jgi:uncharacterized BrkB/YihY/UPF0761 family membrane protein
MRAFVVAQSAIDDISGLGDGERAGIVGGRLRALATIGVIGLAQVVTAIIAAVLSASPLGASAQFGVLAATAVLNVALVLIAYRLLSNRRDTTRELLPGAICSGLIFTGFQLIGSLIVGKAIAHATPVYGTLTWLSLHASAALIGYQLNIVLEQRRRAPFDPVAFGDLTP